MRRSTLLVAAVLLAGCSGGESNRGHRDSVRPGAGPLSVADSMEVVRAAVSALQGSSSRRFEVAQFDRADSGYLVSLLPLPEKPSSATLGGGGLVLVNVRRETRVIRRYQ